MDEPSTVQVVMQGFLLPQFQDWLATRGWQCIRTPFLDEESGDDVLPTYLTTPTEATMHRSRQNGAMHDQQPGG